MKFRYLGALVVGSLAIAACTKGIVPGQLGSAQAGKAGELSAAARYNLLQEEGVCPPPDCCVAITGTSNVTVGADELQFNFEINTAANSPSGIGRVNFTDTAGTANPNDDGHAQWTILRSTCINDTEGNLIGATVLVDFGDDGVADATFTLTGEAQGSHVQVKSLTADKIADGDTPFPDFGTTDVSQNSTQNVFPDSDCDGTPNPGS